MTDRNRYSDRSQCTTLSDSKLTGHDGQVWTWTFKYGTDTARCIRPVICEATIRQITANTTAASGDSQTFVPSEEAR